MFNRLISCVIFVSFFAVLSGCTHRAGNNAEAIDVPAASATQADDSVPGFYISGRRLFDRCGEEVVLRGVNEMTVWAERRDGIPEFREIAKTGANSVRIVWSEVGSTEELNAAIHNAVAQKLIPIVENHNATGKLENLSRVVDWWTQREMVDLIKVHAPYLIVNIANEAGDASVTAIEFLKAYKRAITRMRDAGIATTLIIDAPGWGQNIDILQAVGHQLIDHDPLSNILLSVHMWWNDPHGERVVKELQQSVDLDLPLIVGEFAQHAVAGCDQSPFDYATLLSEAQKHDIGWLAWSWGGVDNSDCADQGSFDMTVNGIHGEWEEPWGEQVALLHPASIANTSIRPFSMISGYCRAEDGR